MGMVEKCRDSIRDSIRDRIKGRDIILQCEC